MNWISKTIRELAFPLFISTLPGNLGRRINKCLKSELCTLEFTIKWTGVSRRSTQKDKLRNTQCSILLVVLCLQGKICPKTNKQKNNRTQTLKIIKSEWDLEVHFQGSKKHIIFHQSKALEVYSSEHSSISLHLPDISKQRKRSSSEITQLGVCQCFQTGHKTGPRAAAQVLELIQGMTLPRVKLHRGLPDVKEGPSDRPWGGWSQVRIRPSHITNAAFNFTFVPRTRIKILESLGAPGDQLLQPADDVEGSSHYLLNSECPGVKVKPLPIVLFSFHLMISRGIS